MKQPKKYQIHLKSQNGPIHVLLVNKDAAANSPVVTPVPPPANDVNSNNHQAVKDGEEPMETNAKQINDVNLKGAAVKTEVLETSRGIVAASFAGIIFFRVHESIGGSEVSALCHAVSIGKDLY